MRPSCLFTAPCEIQAPRRVLLGYVKSPICTVRLPSPSETELVLHETRTVGPVQDSGRTQFIQYCPQLKNFGHFSSKLNIGRCSTLPRPHQTTRKPFAHNLFAIRCYLCSSHFLCKSCVVPHPDNPVLKPQPKNITLITPWPTVQQTLITDTHRLRLILFHVGPLHSPV
jgi:hypothetical protein